MNIELAYSILDILQTMQDAAKQMKQQYSAGNMELFNSLSMDLWDGLFAVQQTARQEVPEGSRIRLADACTCAMESLKDINYYVLTAPQKVEWKLEYELAPIIETATIQFYYWGIVYEHSEEKQDFRQYLATTDTFGILQVAKEERKYDFDLSIRVTGYNHIDYTRQCVESIKKNLPDEVSYELLVFNHGSNDGTKEYFEQYDDIKVINVAVNGVMPLVTNKANIRSKYILNVSNDIIIGDHAIDNLYRCIVEHPQYGYIVPTTPNISNLQTIPVQYSTWEEFLRVAKENNVYSERKHEERVRLCNPIQIMASAIYSQFVFELYEDMCCGMSLTSFPDDKCSLWIRRNGYKCVLAKDAYCHHFGSVTLKHDLGKAQEQQQFYLEGRRDFFKKYGVDPWGLGSCYDLQLFDKWEIPLLDKATVLGINCGLGSNSLKVKEILREKGAEHVTLYNATQEVRFLEDLKGVSDKAFSCNELSDIVANIGVKKYNYVVVEGKLLNSYGKTVQQMLKEAGILYDELAVRVSETSWQIIKADKEKSL